MQFDYYGCLRRLLAGCITEAVKELQPDVNLQVTPLNAHTAIGRVMLNGN